jgi:uncharacterized protein (DUF488 family)
MTNRQKNYINDSESGIIEINMEDLKPHNLECFTVGHSNHEVGQFIDLLKNQEISCLCDVRSSPYSKFTSQFNKENLDTELKKKGVLYVYLGNKLGGRYWDPALLYSNGVVNYNKVIQQQGFCEGINSVILNIKKGLRIALMCAEKNPLDCHRFLLVARALTNKGVRVKHILETGKVVLNEDLEKQLLLKYKNELDQFLFFQEATSKEKTLEEAYQKRNQEVGFISEKTAE